MLCHPPSRAGGGHSLQPSFAPARHSSLTVTAARAAVRLPSFLASARAAASLGLHSPPLRPGPGRSIQSLHSESLLPGRQPAARLRTRAGLRERSWPRPGRCSASIAASELHRPQGPHSGPAHRRRRSFARPGRVGGVAPREVPGQMHARRGNAPREGRAPESGGCGATAGSGEISQMNQSDQRWRAGIEGGRKELSQVERRNLRWRSADLLAWTGSTRA